ncbi:MAG: hypothetical protein ACYTFI_13675, partial [Planctomycetota bacterium]
HGGGIFCDSSASPTITENDIIYNLAFDSLGGEHARPLAARLTEAHESHRGSLPSVVTVASTGSSTGIHRMGASGKG